MNDEKLGRQRERHSFLRRKVTDEGAELEELDRLVSWNPSTCGLLVLEFHFSKLLSCQVSWGLTTVLFHPGCAPGSGALSRPSARSGSWVGVAVQPAELRTIGALWDLGCQGLGAAGGLWEAGGAGVAAASWLSSVLAGPEAGPEHARTAPGVPVPAETWVPQNPSNV